MTFKVNSMTFRVDPERWDSIPAYRLKAEMDEFDRWFNENAADMKPEDAAEGCRLLAQMRETLKKRNDEGQSRYFVDTRTSSALGSQLRFFPTFK